MSIPKDNNMLQEAEFFKKVTAKLFADGIMHTLCGFLLANRKTRRVSLFKFKLSRAELKALFSTVDYINEAGKAYFSINKIHAYLNDNRFDFARRYLCDELLFIIAPHEPTFPFSETTAADRLLEAEKNPPLHRQLLYGSKLSEAIWKSYVLLDIFPPETYKQVDDFADILFSMPICTLSPQTSLPMRMFCRFVYDNRLAYRRIIGGIMSGKYKPGDDVSDLRWQKQEPVLWDFFNSYMNFPTLIELRKDDIVLTRDVSEKRATLPYIVALAEFDFLPQNIRDTLVYSCIQYIKKRTTD